MNKKNMKSGVFPYLSLLCIMIAILFLVKLFDNSTHVLTYNEFIKAVKKVMLKQYIYLHKQVQVFIQ